jgi:hypothetical protein
MDARRGAVACGQGLPSTVANGMRPVRTTGAGQHPNEGPPDPFSAIKTIYLSVRTFVRDATCAMACGPLFGAAGYEIPTRLHCASLTIGLTTIGMLSLGGFIGRHFDRGLQRVPAISAQSMPARWPRQLVPPAQPRT